MTYKHIDHLEHIEKIPTNQSNRMKEIYTYCVIFKENAKNNSMSEMGKIGVTQNLEERLSKLEYKHKREINRRRSFYVLGDHEKELLDATIKWHQSGREYRYPAGILHARKTAKQLNLSIINLDKYYNAIEVAKFENYVTDRLLVAQRNEQHKMEKAERIACIESQLGNLPHPPRIYYSIGDWIPQKSRNINPNCILTATISKRMRKLKKALLKSFLSFIDPNYHCYFKASEGAENNDDCFIYGWYKPNKLPKYIRVERSLEDTSNMFATTAIRYICRKYKYQGINVIDDFRYLLPIRNRITQTQVERLIRLFKEANYTNDILVNHHFLGQTGLNEYLNHKKKLKTLRATDYKSFYNY